MTLSSLFQKPALTTLISGGVTDSIVTSSPAILMGINCGGVSAGGESWNSYYTIKTGSTTLLQGFASVAYSLCSYQSMPNEGIDCPSGITVTIATAGNAQALANSRTTINYILK